MMQPQRIFHPGPALSQLERLLETADPIPGLEAIGQPDELALLFRLELGRTVRGGPNGGHPGPARLLEVAQEAAVAGLVGLAVPLELRRVLRDLEHDLHLAGAWDNDRRLWWEPLPEPTAHEAHWDQLSRRRDSPLDLPRRAELAAAFAVPPAPRYLTIGSLLTPSFVDALHDELEAALTSDLLRLEREGVGHLGELSPRRSDLVTYIDGREPRLLEAAPRFAVLVQWGLHHFGRRLRRATGEAAWPPRHAMLARYPAPGVGYAPHLDNPGGDHDNGRAFTLVIYLNPTATPCRGGEIALWPAGGSTAGEPAQQVAPTGGAGVLFDARQIAHQVRPLREGPPRWALTFWLNAAPQGSALPAAPRLGMADVLLPVSAPPLAPDQALFHELSDERPAGRFLTRSARRRAPRAPRAGIVSTVYRRGAALEAWCEHHFELGFDHLVLIFDLIEEPSETADVQRLRRRWGGDQLTVWSSSQTAERWHALPKGRHWDELLSLAPTGFSSYAIASRQTLNASLALEAARGDELGGEPLAWLFHLDADELLHLEGSGRGGATLEEHLVAAELSGLKLIRYVNHELLLPLRGGPPRFKLNPRLAAARLGQRGWAGLVQHLAMADTDPRPYFNGYFNGKSAVAVPAGTAAAGVHGWSISESCTPAMCSFLAGPSVLHFHFSSAEAFRHKYLAIATSKTPAGDRLFRPSPTEEKTVALVRQLEHEGVDEAEMARQLEAFHDRVTTFDEGHVELLEAAELVLTPSLGAAAHLLSSSR